MSHSGAGPHMLELMLVTNCTHILEMVKTNMTLVNTMVSSNNSLNK